jgi:uncharacterized protein (TIGR02646 family)
VKNVIRETKPLTLHKHAVTWKQDLMAAVAIYKRNGTPIPARLQNKYRKSEVLAALKRMYSDDDGNNFCCYCEAEIDLVDYPHIEHRRPKAPDKFPEKTFEWNNLHLSCSICNQKKLDQWDKNSPILDAVKDNPIKDHLAYCDDETGVYRDALSKRGATTIAHTDMNRHKLRRARQIIYRDVSKAILEILSLKDSPKVLARKQILQNKEKGKFGSLITWLLEEYDVNV